jgi:hypothetical protein
MIEIIPDEERDEIADLRLETVDVPVVIIDLSEPGR